MNLTEGYNMIVNHVEPRKLTGHTHRPNRKIQQDSDSDFEDDVAFLQKSAEHITCFDCGEKGHYKNSAECKKSKAKRGEA